MVTVVLGDHETFFPMPSESATSLTPQNFILGWFQYAYVCCMFMCIFDLLFYVTYVACAHEYLIACMLLILHGILIIDNAN